MWGYLTANQSYESYEEFLRSIPVEIAPMTKLNAEEAAKMKPTAVQILDALIASIVKKYDGIIWTFDKDYLRFLHKSSVRILKE